MSRSRTKKSKSVQTPLFIQKLIEILEDHSIDNIISWTNTNDSFQIKSITQFTQTILPRFFKHNNFSSFIRQLNMYGFRKIRHQDGDNVYENENFIRGNRNLLKNIKRKVNLQKEDRIAIYSNEGQTNGSLSRQIQEMKTKQKDLEQICRHLLVQNHKLIEENNSLMRKFKQEERRKERKIQQLLIAMIAANQNKQPAIMMNVQGSHDADSMIKNQTNNQNGSSVNNILSIMTGENSNQLSLLNEKCQETPLQVLTNAMSRNKSMKQFKQILQKYYNTNNNISNTNSNSNNMNDGYQLLQQRYMNGSASSNYNSTGTRMTRRKVTDLNNGKINNDLLNQNGNNIHNNSKRNNNNNSNNNNSRQLKYGMLSPQKNHQHHNSVFNSEEDSSVFHLGGNDSHFNSQHHQINDPILVKPSHEDDDDGFISINDFMNLDEEKPPHQLHQNIDLEDSN